MGDTPDYRASHLAADCAKQFDGHYTHGRGQLYWQRFERPYLEALFARLSRTRRGRYLDFACGTGRILELASRHFEESVGIDVSAVMLAEARRRVPVARLIQADVMARPPEVGTFDVISLFRFILSAEHHLREGVLLWLRSVIAPSGVLVLNNHLNRRSLTAVMYRTANAFHGEWGASPSDRSMEILLRRCGFAVSEQYGFAVIPPWRDRAWIPSSLIVQLEALLGRSRTLQRYGKDRIYVCTPV